MRMNIQIKVAGLLGLILLVAFGLSTIINAGQTSSTLREISAQSQAALKKSGAERARNVFASLETGARGSLERGEMEVFQGLLTELGAINGVEEMSLTDPQGKIVYSSNQALLNQPLDKDLFDSIRNSQGQAFEQEQEQSLILSRGHYMEADCLRCHVSSKLDDLAGVLYVRYSMADVQQAAEQMLLSSDSASHRAILTNLVTGICGLLAAFAAVYLLLGRTVRRPMLKIRQVMQQLALGRSVEKLAMIQQDEIGETARAMDELADSLQNEVVANLQKLASGDLSFDVTPRDEQDEIRGAIKKLGNDLNEIVSQIQVSGEQIASGSGQVSDFSQSLSQGATEQASSLEEISASLNQMSSQTTMNAENADQANTLSDNAQQAAQKGSTQMQAMVTAMDDINQAGQNISKIIKTIDEIAFQTNLLALNAAVEAARAGQHGKGFAVVAEEVRNLAARSAKAAEETAELIEGSVEKTENGSVIAHQTAEALQEIVGGVTKVSDLVSEIAAASNEQAQGIAQINQGISQVDTVTQQNTATAEESAAAAEELSGQAEQMRQMLQRFTLRQSQQLQRKTTHSPSPVPANVGWAQLEQEPQDASSAKP